MAVAPTLEAARRWYAEDIREVVPIRHDDRVVEAFATVPREHYLGEGPWRIHSRFGVGSVHQSASADPRHLYHDVLVSIDAASGINNGLPSLWAYIFDNLSISAGSRVLQVGAGTGYFTAILAELVGPQGHVIAYEIEEDLAARAAKSLQHYRHVQVTAGDATQATDLTERDIVVACAGVTHIPAPWLNALAADGRMLLPVTGESGGGFLMHLTRRGSDLPVKSLGPCGFFPCQGARLEQEAKAISKALESGNPVDPEIGYYRQGSAPKTKEEAWVIGESFWITRRPANGSQDEAPAP